MSRGRKIVSFGVIVTGGVSMLCFLPPAYVIYLVTTVLLLLLNGKNLILIIFSKLSNHKGNLTKVITSLLVILSPLLLNAQTQTFTSSGTFTLPAGVTSVTVEAWGGGGGTPNDGRARGGGGGGAYARSILSGLSPGTNYTVLVGSGGGNAPGTGLSGGNSSFGSLVISAGGAGSNNNGGAGGLAAASTGDITYSGGNGANRGGSNGGGGGGSAFTNANGNDGNGITGGTGTGNGGNSAARYGAGEDGYAPGGGGGGDPRDGTYDGRGADGQVNVTYTCPTYFISGTSAANCCTSPGTSTVTLTSSTGLPVGIYTVSYNTSSPSQTGLTASMTVSTAGTGTFTATGLTTAGSSTITITNLGSGAGNGVIPLCSSTINTNNTSTINVSASPAQPSNITGSSSPCRGSFQTYSVANVSGVDYTWTFPSGWTQTAGGTTNSVTVTVGANSGDISVTPSSGGCDGTAQTLSVTVGITPVVTVGASSTDICSGASIDLTSSASGYSPTLLSENFEGASNSWSTYSNSFGGTPAEADWTLRSSTYNSGSTYGIDISSNDNSQFYLSDSDMQGFDGTTATFLESPALNTMGYTTLSLSFYHYFRWYSAADVASVQISTDGSAWTDLAQYTSDQGAATNFANPTINLNAYVDEPTLYVRFYYYAEWGYYWAVDNVSITGTPPAYSFNWTSNPAGYSSSQENPTGIIPPQTAYYIAAYTNTTSGCTGKDSIQVTVNPAAPVSVSISANPTGTINEGDIVTFTANPSNGGSTPSYQWQVNGANVGSDAPVYTNAGTLVNGDNVTVILTSSLTCVSNNPATSNTISMVVNPSPDTDGDGIPDNIDLDDDNDGIPDIREILCLPQPFTNGGFLDNDPPGNLSWALFDESLVDGWQTTASDGLIEIWDSGFNGVPSYDGLFHAEINANMPSRLFQTLAVSPGDILEWEIAHRGRNGVDEMFVYVGPTGSPSLNATVYTNNTAWVTYRGNYMVPSGVYEVELGFESGATAGGNPSIGNFIDFVSMVVVSSDQCDFDGDGIADKFDLDSDNDGIYDLWEAGGKAYDTNGNGYIDSGDANYTDADGDGLVDLFDDVDNGSGGGEVTSGIALQQYDHDSDGDPDYFDIDADGDACYDVVEAGFTDGDNDGILGSSPVTVDAKGIVTSGSDGYTTPDNLNSNSAYDFQEAGTTVSLSTQPSNTAVNEGNNAQFTVTATAEVYQWQENDGSGWTNVIDGGVYSGATTATLDLTAPPFSMNNYQYQIVLTSPGLICDTDITSNPALLNVIPPGITISGLVFNDNDAMGGANKVDGTAISSADGNQLYAVLVNAGSNTVVQSAPVTSGTYAFYGISSGLDLQVLICLTNATVGTLAPPAALPALWEFTGEIQNDAGNTVTGNDGTADGIFILGTTSTNQEYVNFGIRKPFNVNISPNGSTDCPDLDGSTNPGFNPDNSNYNHGATRLTFRVTPTLTAPSSWSFDFLISGTVTVTSASSNITQLVLVGDAIPAPTTPGTTSGNVTAGANSYVDMIFDIENTPGSNQEINITVTSPTDNTNGNVGSNTSATFTIDTMPEVGAFN